MKYLDTNLEMNNRIFEQSVSGSTLSLIELCTAITDCSHSTPNWTDAGKLVIRNFNIKKGRLDLTTKYYTDEITFKDRIERNVPEPGDLIISREAPMGEVCIIPDHIDCCLGQRLVLIKPNKKLCNNRFLLYSLMSDFVQKQIKKSNNSGSTVSNLCIPELEKLRIPIVSVEEQIKISNILSSIDYKIDLSNKINFELEQMAKTLYNYWFVQFDFPNEAGKPYKTSGGKMEYNEVLKREIPKGWKGISLSEIAKENSVLCSSDEYNKLEVIDLAVMQSNTISINGRSAPGTFKTNLFKMKKYDILFGAIRPYLKKAGIAPFNGAVNGTIHSYSPVREYDYSFLLCSLFNETTFKYAISVSSSKGTRMPVIESDKLLGYKTAYSNDISVLFNNRIKSFWEELVANIEQNHELVQLRDFLLPLLMNGQVRLR